MLKYPLKLPILALDSHSKLLNHLCHLKHLVLDKPVGLQHLLLIQVLNDSQILFVQLKYT